MSYRDLIIRSTRCTVEQAAQVEELMRLETGGTLDHLTHREFVALARRAEQARVVLVEEGVWQ